MDSTSFPPNPSTSILFHLIAFELLFKMMLKTFTTLAALTLGERDVWRILRVHSTVL